MHTQARLVLKKNSRYPYIFKTNTNNCFVVIQVRPEKFDNDKHTFDALKQLFVNIFYEITKIRPYSKKAVLLPMIGTLFNNINHRLFAEALLYATTSFLKSDLFDNIPFDIIIYTDSRLS